MNSTNYPSPTIQAGEKSVIVDERNEDDVLEQLRREIEELKAEVSETDSTSIAEKLGFKKAPKNAIISVQGNSGNTSSMTEVIHPSPELKEALDLALNAAPIDPEHLILDSHRVNEALATRAQVLTDSDVQEAELMQKPGGYSVLSQGERLFTPIDSVRGWTKEVVEARRAAAGEGNQ